VVVGLRDSWPAEDALAVAFAEASRRGAELVVSVVRDVGVDEALGGPAAAVPHAAVAYARRAFPRVAVTTTVRTGHVAEVLVELSRAAELVVLALGEQPAGLGRKDLLIASHSTCPVVVVRASPTRDGV
jgi:nucleotide-binding universal stress UspA family protein